MVINGEAEICSKIHFDTELKISEEVPENYDLIKQCLVDSRILVVVDEFPVCEKLYISKWHEYRNAIDMIGGAIILRTESFVLYLLSDELRKKLNISMPSCNHIEKRYVGVIVPCS